MCATNNVNILDKVMPPCAEEEMVQYNDTKPASKFHKKRFQEQEINVLKLPAQSPYLNPIEDLWMIL